MILGRFAPLALLLSLAAGACSRDTGYYLARGDAYAKEGNYDAAIIEYRNGIKQAPRSGRTRHRLALAYTKTNDAHRALEESVRAADLLPNDADVQVHAANLLILAGGFEAARDRAVQGVKADPRSVRAQLALGNAMAGLRDLDGAITQAEEAIKLDPSLIGSYSNLASFHAAAGRIEEAERIFKAAIATDPRSVSAVLTLAHFYWILKRNDDADRLVVQALEMAPSGDIGSNRFAATFYVTIGQRDKAERHLRAAVDSEGSASARLRLAEYYLSESRTADAVPLLASLTSDATVGSIAHIRLASIDYAAGRIDQAVTALEALLRSEPRNVQALIVRASILFDQRRFDEARERADAAVAANPTSAQAHFARGRVLVALRQPEDAKAAFNEVLRLNPRAAGAQVELAKLHLEAGATDTALTLAGAVVKSDPGRFDARLLLARGLMARRDLIQAQSVLAELQAAAPEAAIVHAMTGALHGLKKEYPVARAAFERALTLDALQLEAISGMIGLDLAARRQDAARARLDALVAAAPTNAGALTLAGRVYLLLGDLGAAEGVLKRAVEADADEIGAFSLLADVYLRQERLEEARREYAALAARQARPISALTMVGLIFDMQHRTSEARSTFERVMQLDSRAGVAANNLAWIYVEHGENLDVALQYAQTAKAALPDEAPAADTLGWILLKKDLVPLSIVALRQAVQLAPGNASYHYHLGLAYTRSGDKEHAKTALTTALALDRTFTGAADAARKLAGL
jgi:putative PEP-CTERM system TPR-repeat lipoprotein